MEHKRTNKHRKALGERTKKSILEAGLKLWPYVTVMAVAREVGVSHATVIWHFKDVRDAVAKYALEVEDKRVCAYLELEGYGLN